MGNRATFPTSCITHTHTHLVTPAPPSAYPWPALSKACDLSNRESLWRGSVGQPRVHGVTRRDHGVARDDRDVIEPWSHTVSHSSPPCGLHRHDRGPANVVSDHPKQEPRNRLVRHAQALIDSYVSRRGRADSLDEQGLERAQQTQRQCPSILGSFPVEQVDPYAPELGSLAGALHGGTIAGRERRTVRFRRSRLPRSQPAHDDGESREAHRACVDALDPGSGPRSEQLAAQVLGMIW